MFGEIKIGADPEVFVKKNNEIISGENLTIGTKDNPFYISNNGHAIQKDNIMLEFNIPASNTKEDFVNNINICKEYIETLLMINDCQLEIIPSAIINEDYLQTPQSKMFDCDPDFNIYTKNTNPSRNRISNLRTCGGHIHIGIENIETVTMKQKGKLVMAMDAVLGLESLLLDSDSRRRTMYGNAGSFRLKRYGIEYRTLSNFWIKNNELIEWAYNKTLEAVKLVELGLIDDIIKNHSSQIRNCIDNNLVEEAIEIMSKINNLILIK